MGGVRNTLSPEVTTIPIVRHEEWRNKAARNATHMSGTWNVVHTRDEAGGLSEDRV